MHFARVGDDDLGEEQRVWLKDQIEDQRPIMFILVCGSPVIANDRILGDRLSNRSRREIFEMINERKSHCNNTEFFLTFFHSCNN